MSTSTSLILYMSCMNCDDDIFVCINFLVKDYRQASHLKLHPKEDTAMGSWLAPYDYE